MIAKEEEARARQVFDPEKNTYDERKKRVTDLKECSRVTLPKPLRVTREAEIELRREIHNNIYQKYRKEHCNENGEQESNLSKQEERGLASLKRRMSIMRNSVRKRKCRLVLTHAVL